MKDDAVPESSPTIRVRFPKLYEQLHDVAAGLLNKHGGGTISPTDLTHDAFVKLAAEQEKRREGDRSELGAKPTNEFRACFGAVCRDVLVDYERRRCAKKRGGDRHREPLQSTIAVDAGEEFDLLMVDDAITTLQGLDLLMANVVEMRVFSGLTVPECAGVLKVSPRTVDRKWAFARAWLMDRFANA